MGGFNKELEKIYYDPKSSGSYGGIKKLYNEAKEKIPNLHYRDVESWIKDQETYSLFRERRKPFPRLPILVDKIDEQWQADIMDMTWISKANQNYKYLLVIIDCLSRYAWAVPLKDKSAPTVINAFKHVFTKRKPVKLQTDQGKEFKNQYLKYYLEKLNINHFTSTDDLIKCAIVERFNRTLRSRIYRYLHYTNQHKYINVLDDIINAYNNTYHRTIKMTPVQALKNESQAISNVFRGQKKNMKKQKPYKVGQSVRITRAKTIFEKGATSTWSREIYYITKVKHTPQGYVYRLRDWDNEPLTSIFYHDEIFQAVEPDLYKIDKVIKSRINPITKKKEFFVKWVGYPNKFNSWVDSIENV